MDVGRRIVELREQQHLSTNKLANLSGISQSHLRDVELGLKNPTVEFLSYICQGLHITLCDFFKVEPNEIDPYLMNVLRSMPISRQRKLAEFLDSSNNE